jgi:AcrR family transcriptional regulator
LTDGRSTNVEGVTRKEQAEASRTALLAAARSCFTEHGYDDTTVAAILQRAGMARGALYHYFPDGKAQIFAAVFDLVDAEYHLKRDANLALPSAVDRLTGGARAFLQLCTDESFARIALADAPRVVPGQGALGSSFRLLRQQLADAVTAGELASFDVDAMAMALYGAIRNAGEYVTRSSDPRGSAERAINAVTVLIEGLRRRPPVTYPAHG